MIPFLKSLIRSATVNSKTMKRSRAVTKTKMKESTVPRRMRRKKDEEIEETPVEKRKRLADAFLEKLRAKEREKDEDEESEEGEGRRERDTLIAKILQQDQLEESGRVRRAIASWNLGNFVAVGEGEVKLEEDCSSGTPTGLRSRMNNEHSAGPGTSSSDVDGRANDDVVEKDEAGHAISKPPESKLMSESETISSDKLPEWVEWGESSDSLELMHRKWLHLRQSQTARSWNLKPSQMMLN
ncbi:hypothetical protein SASPL_113987 [Salvia splendens]|uniref:Uncharacterized protein n=1 Tax=Salvia splendens TaxID=180675 RepID=A0A8X8Y5K5_SALSN|nr:hypothetical protein SASPL_113987 [Salvia splendens]